MNSYKEGTERRRVQRIKLVSFCPASFDYTGTERKALMIDVSELGARFSFNGTTKGFSLAPGEEIAYTVRTPYGVSHCKGRTVWSRKNDEQCTWGVEFTDLSKDEKDPLRCFIDSPF